MIISAIFLIFSAFAQECPLDYNYCKILCETDYCISICEREYDLCNDNCPCEKNCPFGCEGCDNPICPAEECSDPCYGLESCETFSEAFPAIMQEIRQPTFVLIFLGAFARACPDTELGEECKDISYVTYAELNFLAVDFFARAITV
ncbi:Oidioi.mRNA.OKI2018_I69.chr1.g1737.t1.cds [Oikopleura dioica]|uniref:Oidioi.mRNA.OKI2018_I69.chr1.g1737.t1.cds n=1 Tax=Oikopleura dioica TaxID=34765 RepID=A0ABN7SNV1_OIKDI|nr:Oidioi.mRNA.OKI2018_I69.chr1.g1737.t1.cds [Oikopleura dioica]